MHRSTSARLRMRAPEVHHDVLAARVEHVVEERERLEDVAPVLSLVVQPLVEHLDDLHKVVPAMVAQTKVGRGKSGTSGQLLASQRCHSIAVISQMPVKRHARSASSSPHRQPTASAQLSTHEARAGTELRWTLGRSSRAVRPPVSDVKAVRTDWLNVNAAISLILDGQHKHGSVRYPRQASAVWPRPQTRGLTAFHSGPRHRSRSRRGPWSAHPSSPACGAAGISRLSGRVAVGARWSAADEAGQRGANLDRVLGDAVVYTGSALR